MKARLSVLYFLQFSVWGCYLTSFGQFLGASGLGSHIAWFYAAIGLVSILTPALMGHISDRYVAPPRLLSVCHLIAATAMFSAWIYCHSNPMPAMGVFYPLYLLFLCFYMPTMALANATSFAALTQESIRPVDAFPSIRIWGTVGFVAAMWMVNSLYFNDGHIGFTLSDSNPYSSLRFQYNGYQLLCASILGAITSLYCLSLPTVKARRHGGNSLLSINTLRGFLSNNALRKFLLFAALTGVCLQISNGFATSYITHFQAFPEYVSAFASGNATFLFSLSQISEAVCILLVGITMKKFGFRFVFAAGILAWCLRFLFLGLGNPSAGLWLLIASMVVYGIAFNFVTIAGSLYVESISPENHKGLGQGVMMLFSNGIGATLGTLAAGKIVNHWCQWQMSPAADGSQMRLFMGEWIYPWIIFATYAFFVFLLWIIFAARKN